MHTTTRTIALALLTITTILAIAQTASASTINPVPDIMYVVWPLSSSTAAVNVTFAIHDCTSTSGSCAIQSVTSGTTPTLTITLRNAGAIPLTGLTRAMVACGGAQTGWWCYNETVQFDQALNGAYVAYGGMVMWSTGVSPANTWQGQSFQITSKEVRLTSSIDDSNLPEGRGHANATWESQAHANATWCAQALPCDASGYESATHANATWESQAHANATWESQAHANATWEAQQHANATWESQAHANASWCPQPACALNGDQLVSRSYADSTYEGQPHANATWVRNSWFNNTFRPAASFGSISATSLTVGAASAGDLTISGSMSAQTAIDPYVMPLVFGGLTVFATAASLWISRKPGILGKLAIAILLVVAALWAAGASVSADANAFRWVAVLVTSGWTILVLYSMKGQGVNA